MKVFARDLPRAHGYGLSGQRCTGCHDRYARGRVNALGALLVGVLLSVGLTFSNVDAEFFNLWLDKGLLLKLPPGAVIVMDNVTFHKRNDTRDMIENAGHHLEFLPPYSPVLNLIESKWAQSNAIIKISAKNPERNRDKTILRVST